MSTDEYMKQRLAMLEISVRHVMMMLSETTPYLSSRIDSLGREWDRQLDALEIELSDTTREQDNG